MSGSSLFSTISDLRRGSQPLVLVDVGARGGTKAPWSELREGLTIVGFEPENAEFQRLKSNQELPDRVNHRYYPNALWSSSGPTTLYVTRGRGKSSLLKPNRPWLSRFFFPERYDIVEEASLTAKTLDEVLAPDFPDGVDFIKLDCQGADMAILQGAPRTLGGTFGIEVEVLFGELYDGTPRFAEIDQLLRAAGFALFDLKLYHWKRGAGLALGKSKGQLVFADALYFRDTNTPVKFRSRQELLKALQIVALYGYADYCLELAEANRALLSDGDWDALRRALRASRQPAWLGKLPGRRFLLRGLLWLMNKLSTHLDPSANISGRLGNR